MHTTIRTVIALAVHHCWPIRQLDVHNAFLYGFLTKEVYMRQPVRFVDPNFSHHVCHLHMSLYGLKQARRVWFKRFSNYLEDIGFSRFRSDYSLFIYHRQDILIFLLIYVYDILIIRNNSTIIFQFIEKFGTHFSMRDLGNLHYFLGVEANYTNGGLYLCQTKYIIELLLRTQFQDANPINSHVPAGRKLSRYDGAPLPDASMYRSIIGALQYIIFTHPDLSFAMNQVCQFMHQPTSSHWMAVKRILRYLKKILTNGLFYKPGALSLQGFSDADYGGDPDDKHSTGGYCIYLGGYPIF